METITAKGAARGSTRRSNLLVTMLVCGAVTTTILPSEAHEPLWGETPIVFSSGLIHPEVKVSFMDAGSTANGGIRARMFEQEYMIQYAPKPTMNLILEVPYYNNLRQQLVGGRLRSAPFVGLGDITLTAKSRLHAKQEEGLSIQQTALYGIKLPTGRSNRLDPDGTRAAPHDQTGTGKPGVVLGYAIDRETLKDTIWASVEWRREFGGGFRMGDMAEANVAYGRWVKQANEAAELGINLAAGLHGEWHASDSLGGGLKADNRSRLVGIHTTAIVTRGNHQWRAGVLIPIERSGPADHVDFPYQVKVAFETFF